MNHLCVSTCEAIKTLSAKGWSRRRIARGLGIDRETASPASRTGKTSPSDPRLGRSVGYR